MREETHEISMLLDFYGELLSEKQRECVTMYYDENMSLSEIAEQVGITRQGVLDFRIRGVAKLREFEMKIGLIARFAEQRQILERMFKQLDELAVLTEGQAGEIISALRENLGKINI